MSRTKGQTGHFIALLLAVYGISTRALSQTGASPPASRTPAISYYSFGGSTKDEPKIHMVVFPSSQFTLRVVDNGTRASSPAYPNLAEAMRRNRCVAGINGGFFSLENFTPAGMMISDGRTVSSFDARGWQEGVLAVRNRGIELTERDVFAVQSEVVQGLQSSPWLIRSGRIEAAHQSDRRSAPRSFVAADDHGLWAIGKSSSATFQEVSQLLLSSAVSQRIQVRKALAMDGGPSAGFWSNLGGIEVSDPERTTDRNFLGIVPLH